MNKIFLILALLSTSAFANVNFYPSGDGFLAVLPGQGSAFVKTSKPLVIEKISQDQGAAASNTYVENATLSHTVVSGEEGQYLIEVMHYTEGATCRSKIQINGVDFIEVDTGYDQEAIQYVTEKEWKYLNVGDVVTHWHARRDSGGVCTFITGRGWRAVRF